MDDFRLSPAGVHAEHTPAATGRGEHMIEDAPLRRERRASMPGAVEAYLAHVADLRGQRGEATELSTRALSRQRMGTQRETRANLLPICRVEFSPDTKRKHRSTEQKPGL